MNVRRTLADLGVRPSKSLGQNFLVHPQMAGKIVSAAPANMATAVEIGPGLGALTESLIERGVDVRAVEIDRRLCVHLKDRFLGKASFSLVESDALKLHWGEWLSETRGPRVLFGNLPYSAGAAIIEKLFRHAGLFAEAILCLQSEVSERILSAGGRSMGPVTLLVHRFCLRREKLFRIPPGGFHPRPKVSSTVFRLVLRPSVVWDERDAVVPRALFSHRRKKLSSCLGASVLKDLADAGGRPYSEKRIDELSVEEAALLAGRVGAQEDLRN